MREDNIPEFKLGEFLQGRFPIFVGRPLLEEPRPEYDLLCRPHRHDCHEIIVVRGGKGVHRMDGRSMPVNAGDVFVILKGEAHHLIQDGPLEIIDIMFGAHIPESFSARTLSHPGYRGLFSRDHDDPSGFPGHARLDDDKLLKLISMSMIMDRDWNKRQDQSATLVQELESIIDFLSEQYALAVADPETRARLKLRQVLNLLEEQCDKKWQMNELARQVGLSRSAFFHLFAQATGATPLNYLLEKRIERAKTLLLESEETIIQIAHQCGFHDSTYFARQFKKHTGATPKQFQKSKRNSNKPTM